MQVPSFRQIAWLAASVLIAVAAVFIARQLWSMFMSTTLPGFVERAVFLGGSLVLYNLGPYFGVIPARRSSPDASH